MSDTPRTDAVTEHYFTGGLRSASVVRQNFARELERELARVTAERDEAREMYCREAARHSVCRRSIMDARTIARMNGWDCFGAKEAKP